MKNPTLSLIEDRIKKNLNPLTLEILDDSAKHAGHAGAASGGGHYQIFVVSQAFINKAPLARHRMVYQALEGLVGHEIHAVQIFAKTPEEASTAC